MIPTLHTCGFLFLAQNKRLFHYGYTFHGPMPFPLSFVIICGCMGVSYPIRPASKNSLDCLVLEALLRSCFRSRRPQHHLEGSKWIGDWRKKGFPCCHWGTPKSSMLGFTLINHPFWVPHLWKLPYQFFTKKTEEIATVRRFPPSNGQV